MSYSFIFRYRVRSEIPSSFAASLRLPSCLVRARLIKSISFFSSALAPKIAPVKAMVSPLLKNKPELVAKARGVYSMLKEQIPQIMWDDNGNIGKRYRRQDEIGTPYCITIDFDTLGETPDLKDTVTLRDRDSGEQERISIDILVERIV